MRNGYLNRNAFLSQPSNPRLRLKNSEHRSRVLRGLFRWRFLLQLFNKLVYAFCGFSELTMYKLHVQITDTSPLKPQPVVAGSHGAWLFLHMQLLSCTRRVSLLLCRPLYSLACPALELTCQSWAGDVCKIRQ